ncbi:MAG: hypothetical protein FJ161_05055 [Gammaproteobacteria bacterium]|nr:hypothetical protein [Gammaproteobacteria bacterium]
MMMTQWLYNSLQQENLLYPASESKIWSTLQSDFVIQGLSSEYLTLCQKLTKEQISFLKNTYIYSPIAMTELLKSQSTTKLDHSIEISDLRQYTQEALCKRQERLHYIVLWPESMQWLAQQYINENELPPVPDCYCAQIHSWIESANLCYWIDHGYHQSFEAAWKLQSQHNPKSFHEYLKYALIKGEAPIVEYLIEQAPQFTHDDLTGLLYCALQSHESGALKCLLNAYPILHDLKYLEGVSLADEFMMHQSNEVSLLFREKLKVMFVSPYGEKYDVSSEIVSMEADNFEHGRHRSLR